MTIENELTYEIVGSDTDELTTSITLSYVLHIPKLALNLISLSIFTKDLNCCIILFLDCCLVQDLVRKQIVGKGTHHDGLYIFCTWVPKVVPCPSVVFSFNEQYRMGHPSLNVLKKLCHELHDVYIEL